jgi:hypothetical protein
MNREQRISAARAVTDAADFATEQAALAKACVVDIRPTLPAGAADLYHQWDVRQEPETTADFAAVCKAVGAGYDRGAQRYVIRAADWRRVYAALVDAGFVPCVSPSIMAN